MLIGRIKINLTCESSRAAALLFKGVRFFGLHSKPRDDSLSTAELSTCSCSTGDERSEDTFF